MGAEVRNYRAIGAKKQAVGSAFEGWVTAQHEKAIYKKILVHVTHNQPTMKKVKGRLIYAEATCADYTGCLADGRYYAAEAKSTGEDKIYRSVISPLQQRHLDAVSAAGAMALLLVEFRVDGLPRRYRIPWTRVPWAVARSAESLSEADLVASGILPLVRDPLYCFLQDCL